MDPFEQMQVFCQVAELQSFAKAAKQLQLSAPTVTRAVASLEQRLDSQLLSRTTRGVSLTPAGKQYLADSERILRELQDAEASATGVHRSSSGQLVIAAPFLYGQEVITPLLLRFRQRYPEIQVRALFLDRPVHLYDEGIDVAFMMGAQADSSLVALPLGQVQRVLVASPAYLARFGCPSHPSELSAHRLVQSQADQRSNSWQLLNKPSDVTSLRDWPITPVLVTSTNNAAKQAALAGLGISRLMAYQCQTELAGGHLQLLLADFQQPPLPVYLVYREGRKASARVRALVDFALDALR